MFLNFTIPSWAVELVNDISDRVTYFSLLTETEEMKRLAVGPLLDRLLQNMMMNETSIQDVFERSRSGPKKIYFFSGHDVTVGAFLNTLGMYDKKRPPYTAALILELHQDPQTQRLYIEVCLWLHNNNFIKPKGVVPNSELSSGCSFLS